MILIKINDMEYYDDAVTLVKSFYPRTEVTWQECENLDLIIETQTPDFNGTKAELHEWFKLKLYKELVEQTGKTLPWGDMTGVRPSKLALQMLEANETEEAIYNFFENEHLTSRNKAELALNVAKKERSILSRINIDNGYSLYVGIPFCPTTCLYCSFTSYPLSAWKNRIDEYLDALIKELKFVSESMKGKTLNTIYFGGGTPTTLEPEKLDRLFTELRKYFDVDSTIEFTVESGRPDSITREKLMVLKKHGVTRISINPQTMNQETLDVIGRRHTVSQVVEAFKLARECGFDNINMDMILALPGEGEEEVASTLKQISELRPESLTVHSLAIKRAAALNVWREKYKDFEIKNTDVTVDMAANCARELGMEPYYMYRQKNMAGNYENVGYSIPGLECIYNVLIMEEKQTIVATGAGASSKIVFQDEGNFGRIERI